MVHLKFITKSALLVVFIVISLNGLGICQTIQFDEPLLPTLGTRYIGIPKSVNDSIAEFNCFNNNLSIIAKKNKENLLYAVFYNDNLLIEQNWEIDSIAKWNEEEAYDMQSVKFCSNGHNFFLIPGTKIVYNDKAYNQFPFMVSLIDYKVNSNFAPDIELFLCKNDTANFLKVSESGVMQSNEIIGDVIKKEQYKIGDTLSIGGLNYVIATICWENGKVEFEQLEEKIPQYTNAYKLPAILLDYFGSNNYLLIDFWGTWCAPCLQTFPKLKLLSDEYNNFVSILSICEDLNENELLANEILEKNGVTWNAFFEEIGSPNSIANYFEITNYPTFLLANKEGAIMYKVIGDNGLNQIESIIIDLYEK